MAKIPDIVIVGAGLFGSVAARLARARGAKVTVVDCLRPWAASKASGCVMAPSWASGLVGKDLDRAGSVLHELFTVHAENFQTHLGLRFKASRVDLASVLVRPDLLLEVASVGDGQVRTSAGVLRGKVLVAAGVESGKLVPGLPLIRPLWGASTVWNASQLEAPRLHLYAPYRQAVAFNRTKSSVWMGDGTAMVEATWAKDPLGLARRTADRGRALFGLRGDPVTLAGARPYVEGHKTGYFERVHANTWVSTGGAKNGTLLAALQASKFIEAVL